MKAKRILGSNGFCIAAVGLLIGVNEKSGR